MPDPAPSGDGGQALSTPAVIDPGQAPSTQPDTDGQAPGTEGLTVPDPSAMGESFSKVNPADLPDELKPIYNSMLTDYRSKTAEIADLREQATAFQGLMGNPQFKAAMESLSKGEPDAKPASSPAGLDLNSVSGDELIDKLIDNPSLLTQLIDDRAKQIVEPLATHYYDDLAAKQITEMRAKYSDFQENEPKIAGIVGKYGVSLDEAYKLVTYDTAIQKGVNKATELTKKRDEAAQPGVSNPNVEPTGYKTVKDAWEAAKRATGWAGN